MKRFLCVITIICLLIIWGLYKLGIAPFDCKITDKKAIIISKEKDTTYMNVYLAKIANKKYLMYIKKSNKKLNIGDEIEFNGKYSEANGSRNYGGFNYKLYLRSKNIYGIYKIDSYKLIKNRKSLYWKIEKFFFNIRENITTLFINNMSKDSSALLIGLIIGDKSYIDTDVIENFRKASLSHILAISGAHFSYIILILNFINKKLKHRRLGYFINIIFMIFFMKLTGASPSVIRAGLMNITAILAKILHRKNDFWTSLSLSLFIQMMINPYVIFDMGLILSYSGVIGIVTLYKKIYKIIKLKMLSVTLAANIFLLPIMIYNFNNFSISFVVSNIIASIVLGPIIVIGILSVIIRCRILFVVLDMLAFVLNETAKITSQLPFSEIIVVTPSFISIGLYYLIIYYKKKYMPIMLIGIIIFNINFEGLISNIKSDLLINMVDVSQGDCTLIRYQSKNILIDGGGSLDKNYNVGKSILLPYLLDKKINKIDYLIFSHFDSDHCLGLLFLMQKIKIKNAVIGIQSVNNENLKQFYRVCKQRKINIIVMENGKKLNIKNLKLKALWPDKNDLIGENAINNNSLVLKLEYKKFRILFTGDIEKIAEEKLIKEDLESDILKAPHHGSNTSTSDNFLEKVNPRYVIIGVGKNNKFKHPSDSTIEKLNKKKIKIFRTDDMGEISIKTNGKKIKFNTFIKTNYKC